MKKLVLTLLVVLTCSAPLSAQAGARDAVAVRNRCGKPLKGDTTVYTNEGSTRTLDYERGTLLFTRVGDDGWRFVSGNHKSQHNLNAEQMSVFLPCLTLALADSAAPGPLRPVTEVERIEVSAKQSFKQLILYSVIGLVVLGLIFFLMSRRGSSDEDDE